MSAPHRISAILAVVALGLGGVLLTATPAAAVDCTPVSSTGNGLVAGTLRFAMEEANTGPCDTIVISATGTVPAIAEDLPDLVDDVTISGGGADVVTVQAIGDVFNIAGASLSVWDLTIASNGVGDNGIDATDASVSISGVVLNGFAGSGILFTGVDSGDTFDVSGSASSFNTGYGVQLTSNGGAVTIDDLLLEQNDESGMTALVIGGSFQGTDIVSLTNGGAGVEITSVGGATASLIDGHAAENTGPGYVLLAGDAGLAVSGSRAFDNEAFGILAISGGADASLTLTGVEADHNFADGIVLNVSDGILELRSSSSHDNGVDPCLCGGAGITLSAYGGTTTIDDTEVYGNSAPIGAGLLLNLVDGELTISNSHIHDNVAFADDEISDSGYGGGITLDTFVGEDARLNVVDSVIEDNEAEYAGGGVYAYSLGEGDTSGIVKFIRTTIAGNQVNDVDGYGGGLAVDDFSDRPGGEPLFIIDSSTISGNTAAYTGGFAAYKRSSTENIGAVQVIDSTISGNTGEEGAGVFFGAGAGGDNAFLLLEHSTVADNTDPVSDQGGVYLTEGAGLVLQHTILAGNGIDLFREEGTTLAAEWNIVQNPDATDGLDDPADHNRTGIDPKLGPLADNGGPTLTHLLLDGSPAIDTGNPDITGNPEFDQRGSARIVRIIDIGAVEVQPTLPATGPDAPSGLVIGGLALLIAGGALLVARRRTA
jgi:LPXTG-motif cell wall-anchored protein